MKYLTAASKILVFSLGLFFLSACGSQDNSKKDSSIKTADTLTWPDTIYYDYTELNTIGKEDGVTRRDPSDVIKVGDTYYVYYTKVFGRAPGYWGTIWAAKSTDEGKTWKEIGEVLGTGPEGAFDSHATFTPNILAANGKYYLYYTGVKPTPGKDDFDNNSVNDFTAIGVAVSPNPEGPFIREDNPVVTVSKDTAAFDSYRVDDASLVVRDETIYLYYKGRSLNHGATGPRHTKMGVAMASDPTGPFKKHPGHILSRGHEVLVWKKHTGVAALASFSQTIEYAPDGIDFTTDSLGYKVRNIPKAPGLYRVDLTDHDIVEEPGWGISMIHGKDPYLIKFSMVSE